MEEELTEFFQTPEEVESFYQDLAAHPKRQARILDALETQLDLLTDLTLLLAEQAALHLTDEQQSMIQTIKKKLMPLYTISLHEAEESTRFAKLVSKKKETRQLQEEYRRVKKAKEPS